MENNSAIFNPQGFDIAEVKSYHKKNGTLYEYPKAILDTHIDPLPYLEHPCDILVLAAIDRQVNNRNADKLQCKLLVEASSGGVTYMAEEMLLKRGIVTVPDLLLSLGGFTVSYFEWLKNIDHVAPGRLTKKYEEKKKIEFIEKLGYKFPQHSPQYKKLAGAKEIDIVHNALEDTIAEAARKHWLYALENELNFRDACYVRAIKKIYKHFEQAGMML